MANATSLVTWQPQAFYFCLPLPERCFLYGCSLLAKKALVYDGIPSTSVSQWERNVLIWHSQKRRQLFRALLCQLCVCVFLSAVGTSFDLVGFSFFVNNYVLVE